MKRLTGNEEFTSHGTSTGISVSDFWRWAYSDLLNNTYRGVMAEFLVLSSFKNYASFNTQIRSDWLPFDITSPFGRRIEVKSAAYLQSWTTDARSQIRFDIAPKRAWDGKEYAAEVKRNCDLYVFCLYSALSYEASILDLDHWEFYLLSTSVLNDRSPNQKTISLSSLLRLEPIKTGYAGLGAAIESIKL